MFFLSFCPSTIGDPLTFVLHPFSFFFQPKHISRVRVQAVTFAPCDKRAFYCAPAENDVLFDEEVGVEAKVRYVPGTVKIRCYMSSRRLVFWTRKDVWRCR
jgi:hypothetical protein